MTPEHEQQPAPSGTTQPAAACRRTSWRVHGKAAKAAARTSWMARQQQQQQEEEEEEKESTPAEEAALASWALRPASLPVEEEEEATILSSADNKVQALLRHVVLTASAPAGPDFCESCHRACQAHLWGCHSRTRCCRRGCRRRSSEMEVKACPSPNTCSMPINRSTYIADLQCLATDLRLGLYRKANTYVHQA